MEVNITEFFALVRPLYKRWCLSKDPLDEIRFRAVARGLKVVDDV